jgi:uncharacterized protein YodC (DUF2158 family)
MNGDRNFSGPPKPDQETEKFELPPDVQALADAALGRAIATAQEKNQTQKRRLDTLLNFQTEETRRNFTPECKFQLGEVVRGKGGAGPFVVTDYNSTSRVYRLFAFDQEDSHELNQLEENLEKV